MVRRSRSSDVGTGALTREARSSWNWYWFEALAAAAAAPTDWRAAGTGNGDVGGVAGQVAGVRPVMLLPLTMYIQLPSALKVMSCGS